MPSRGCALIACLGLSIAGSSGAVSGPAMGWGAGASSGITASAIAVGGYHDCALQAATGAVVCWGENSQGAATPPDSVNGTLGTASAIAAGQYHSCAIRVGTDAIVCWGSNVDGQSTPPAGSASAIAAGGGHSCAIRLDTGAVVCWGSNGYGQAT